MAALIRHGLQKCSQQIMFVSGRINMNSSTSRYYAKKVKPNPRPKTLRCSDGNKIQSRAESLAARGFLRSDKEYNPPSDVEAVLNGICKTVVGKIVPPDTRIDDSEMRFNLFNACFQEFDHGISNSLLHTMETIGDVLEYYKTPVNTTMPLDAMKKVDLPPNLHIQYEYHRFHPETDTMFGGVTAFNKSSTLVTGLKYKRNIEGM